MLIQVLVSHNVNSSFIFSKFQFISCFLCFLWLDCLSYKEWWTNWLYSNCCYHCTNYSRKIKLLTYIIKYYTYGFSWVFGHIYSLIFHMYSYTFIFKIFGFIRVFILVSRKKMYKSHSSFWNRFCLLLAFIVHLHVGTFVDHY